MEADHLAHISKLTDLILTAKSEVPNYILNSI